MRKVVVLTVLFIGGMGAAFETSAQDRSGFYLGASAGDATNESGEFKDTEGVVKFTAGYAFNPHFGVEVAYLDTGTQEDTIGLTEIEVENSGVLASALVRLPLGESFAVFGRIGYAFYDSKTTARLGDLSARESDSDEDLAYGVGLELAVWGGLRLRAEYEAVDVSDGDFQMVSGGVGYKF